jgi:hypothetical protein
MVAREEISSFSNVYATALCLARNKGVDFSDIQKRLLGSIEKCIDSRDNNLEMNTNVKSIILATGVYVLYSGEEVYLFCLIHFYDGNFYYNK